MSVIIETSIGDFVVDLFTDERPKCCLNFLKLCKTKYYNFSLFHTVQQNLVAQTGDPTATGRGGESIFRSLHGESSRFFEMETAPRILHSKQGLISMVNNGKDMHGSQFFLTLADGLDYLNGKHTVFGEVAEGFEIIEKLNNTFCDADNRPHQDIRIYHTIILHDPYDDPDGLVVPAESPPPTQEMLDSDRIPCDADVNEDEGKTEKELAEIRAEKEEKANAQILEMIGDLPDTEIAPPENVLFVCKLNPVTTSDDLEIIFSRFGKIVSCEVIKDKKTGESLQYAFVEFEDKDCCENAYFKMDNVLIDDRRIHVDFSQSVSKLKWMSKMDKGQETIGTERYVLKSQQRRSDGYDLVFEGDGLISGAEKNQGMKATLQKKSNNSTSRKDYRDDKTFKDPRKEKNNRERDDKRDKHNEKSKDSPDRQRQDNNRRGDHSNYDDRLGKDYRQKRGRSVNSSDDEYTGQRKALDGRKGRDKRSHKDFQYDNTEERQFGGKDKSRSKLSASYSSDKHFKDDRGRGNSDDRENSRLNSRHDDSDEERRHKKKEDDRKRRNSDDRDNDRYNSRHNDFDEDRRHKKKKDDQKRRNSDEREIDRNSSRHDDFDEDRRRKKKKDDRDRRNSEEGENDRFISRHDDSEDDRRRKKKKDDRGRRDSGEREDARYENDHRRNDYDSDDDSNSRHKKKKKESKKKKRHHSSDRSSSEEEKSYKKEHRTKDRRECSDRQKDKYLKKRKA